MKTPTSRIKALVGSAGLLALLAVGAWQLLQPSATESGLASGNGRLVATEIDIATRLAGRISQIVVSEGDFVQPGQRLVQMATDVLEAERSQAQAEVHQARTAILTAEARVAQRQSEYQEAQALVAQRQAELTVARQRYQRTEVLARRHAMSSQDLDDALASRLTAEAALKSSQAQVLAAEAAATAARSEVGERQAALEAALARVERLDTDIRDSQLKSPVRARVQYRIAEPGEILGVGGKVLNLINLMDVYMIFFLPTAEAGRITPGAEARLVLDAFPEYVIPARISHVASEAQFTPKTVETHSEREKLMFRIKARIEPELLEKYWQRVKTGLPGVAYVRTDPQQPWPEHLQLQPLP